MEIKRILIVQTAFIGDVILTTPLIRATAELYPMAEIDALVVPAAAKLLENNPHLHTVISYPKRHNALKTMLKMILRLKNSHYDMAISPHSSFRTHLILLFSKIPVRIGFNRGNAAWMLTKKIKHFDGFHKISKNLFLLKAISTKDFDLQTELFPSTEDFIKAEELLSPLSNKQLIAIAPGSIWLTKCWLPQYYDTLCQKLLQNGYALVLIGGASDKPVCDAILANNAANGTDIINLAGITNLLESAAVIKRCKLMICNDSGALHIANAMQTKVFAFFGPTVQKIGYYPYREGDKVFEVELKCRPCGSHGGNKCPLGHHNCMKQISPESVLQSVLATLQAKNGA